MTALPPAMQKAVDGLLQVANELDEIDGDAWARLGGVSLGGAIRWELIEAGLIPDPRGDA